jgi:hypothetical protein
MMGYGLAGGEIMGIAHEVTPGTYVAPTKFFPFRSESLVYQQDTIWRRPIRASVANIGGVAGNSHVEGDIEIEGLEDVVPYFLYCTRNTVVKSGATNYVYTTTPSAAATAPSRTMSVTIVRNGIVFGYTGCVVGTQKYSIDNGMLVATYSMVGFDEAVQSSPTATWPTTVPFGPGQYSIQIPTATQIFDVDSFEFNVDDNAGAEFRMKNTNRAAQFIRFGERAVDLSLDRDFQDRTDYDAFKALTAQSITLLATKGVNNSVQFLMASSIKDTYEINGSGQGDLLRSKIKYQCTLDSGTSKDYEIIVKTQESIV